MTGGTRREIRIMILVGAATIAVMLGSGTALMAIAAITQGSLWNPSLFLAVLAVWVLGGLLLLYWRARRVARAFRAADGMLCPRCGHALAGLGDQGICPECGAAFERREVERRWRMLIDNRFTRKRGA